MAADRTLAAWWERLRACELSNHWPGYSQGAWPITDDNDENNPGVRAHMAAGHLVDPATVASAVSEAQAVELERLRAKVAELEAAAPAPAKKTAAKPTADKGEG